MEIPGIQEWAQEVDPSTHTANEGDSAVPSLTGSHMASSARKASSLQEVLWGHPHKLAALWSYGD